MFPAPTRPNRTSHRYRLRALAADAVALSTAIFATALISPTPSPTGAVPSQPVEWSLLFALAVVLISAERHAYAPPVRVDLLDVLREIFGATAVAATMTMTARVLIANDAYVAAETIRLWIVALGVLGAVRIAFLWQEMRARRKGRATRPTVIIGAGQVARRIADRLLREPELGLRPIAFVDSKPLKGQGGPSDDLSVLSPDDISDELIRGHGIEHAVLAFGWGGDQHLPDMVRRLWRLGVSVSVVPRLYELGGERSMLAWLGGLPLTKVQPEPTHTWRMHAKYGLDRVAAALAIVVLSPVLAAITLSVRIAMGRPILYRQLRTGNDGRNFWMLKFRTMREAPAGEEADAAWAAAMGVGDPVADAVAPDDRTTPLGRALRRYGLDELPQLLNVLKGDMSLIGPRPERVHYAEAFEGNIRRYADRRRVKSGLTGWAQVSGLRGETCLHDRVEWDNHYIEHWTPWMDLKIILLTIPQLMRGTRA